MDNTAAVGLVRPIEHGANIEPISATKYIGGHGAAIGGVVVDGGNFRWDNGKFPDFTEPDPAYDGIKYWDAFGNFPGLGNVAYVFNTRVKLLRDTGATLAPFHAWLFIQGLETLPLRIKKHSENALEVAKFLSDHPKVSWVNYPGLPEHPSHKLAQKYFKGGYGALVGFGVKGGKPAGIRTIESLKLFSLLANIGDTKSLVIHPASTTHLQLTLQSRSLQE